MSINPFQEIFTAVAQSVVCLRIHSVMQAKRGSYTLSVTRVKFKSFCFAALKRVRTTRSVRQWARVHFHCAFIIVSDCQRCRISSSHSLACFAFVRRNDRIWNWRRTVCHFLLCLDLCCHLHIWGADQDARVLNVACILQAFIFSHFQISAP